MTTSPFDTSAHTNKLFLILKEIYSDATIAPLLGFKGGTAASMFYGLSRFSVDLDFDLLDHDKEDYVFDRIEQIGRKYGSLKDKKRKRFNLFFVVSYREHAKNIKIEINRRQFGSRYELKTRFGVTMSVMVREDMFAHKLMALHERLGKTSRDVYDVWFFLENTWPINKEIVEQRSNMPFPQLLERCIVQLEQMHNRNILDGLGELLTEQQKDWARTKLRADILLLLKARLESEKWPHRL